MTATTTARTFLAGVPKDPSPELVKSAIRFVAVAATDFSWLSKGDAVFVKPASNSGKPYPATTSPIALAAIIELLKEKGAGRVIVGDMSGIEHVKLTPKGFKGSSRRLMEHSGMARAAVEAGAELHFFEEAGWDAFYEDLPAAGSHWKRGLMMPNILKEVDHIVLMPRCARHVLAGATLGLKAAVGYWRTDTRLEYHRDAATFHEKTAEGNTVKTLLEKQRLVLSAADKILSTFGPDDGYVLEPETGLMMASESVTAHEMVSLAWLLLTRRMLLPRNKDAFRDNSRWLANVANHWVVSKLSQRPIELASEKLIKNDLEAIWDDRVLNRSFQVLGGRPKPALEAVDDTIPADLMKRLEEMTVRPS